MRLIQYIICGALFFSCASRKVDVSKEQIKTKIDSTSVVRIDSTSETKNNIKYTESYTELEIKPLNDSLAIVIDGTSYFNAVLRYKKNDKVFVDTSTKTASKNVLKEVSKFKQETKNTKLKSVDKKVNYFVYLWLLLIPVGIYIWRKFKQSLFF